MLYLRESCFVLYSRENIHSPNHLHALHMCIISEHIRWSVQKFTSKTFTTSFVACLDKLDKVWLNVNIYLKHLPQVPHEIGHNTYSCCCSMWALHVEVINHEGQLELSTQPDPFQEVTRIHLIITATFPTTNLCCIFVESSGKQKQ